MLNKIWFFLLLLGIVYGFGKAAVQTTLIGSSRVEVPFFYHGMKVPAPDAAEPASAFRQMGTDLNQGAMDAATTSVEICIKLIGIMALWLGLLRIAQDAGLVDAVAQALRPLMRWLFPDVPDGHPAQGAMLMNISANMLGLDNAATPLGLKAMRELQTLNQHPETATNAMATFLALNTSNVTLIPFTIIAYRVAAGSANPAGPLVAMILTTLVSTIVAIIVVRWMARWPRFAITGPRTSPRRLPEG